MERCKGVNELSHVNSIVRVHGPLSSFYMVRCNDGYHLRHGERSYECKEGQWFPQIFCDAKESVAIWATSHSYGKIFYASPKLFDSLRFRGIRIEKTDLLTVQYKPMKFESLTFYVQLKASVICAAWIGVA
mgnify:FL=1